MQGSEKKERKKKNKYFDENTEAAVVRFGEEVDLEKKEKIFIEDIKPAFAKLIENMIFVYKFHTLGGIDVLKSDCLSFLYESLVLGKFDPTKGHKAFSYFNVISKHWFIQKVKTHKKKSSANVHFDNALLSKLEQGNNQAVVFSYEDDVLSTEFSILLKDEMKKWRSKFDKEQEKKVLEAVILLFDNPELISIYKKKGIYLYIREITGLNTKQVVTNLCKLRKKYSFFKKRYDNGEI